MEVQISWLAILLATVSTMVVGSIWYAPFAFGKKWQKLAKLSDKQMQQGAGKAMVKALVASFITAYVLAHITYLSSQFYTDVSFLMSGVLTAFYVWLGFSAATVITHDSFEQRPKELTLLTIGNEFVTLLVIGLIIGIFPPA